MELLTALFGAKDHVSLFQECARAVLIFFYGLVLLRLSGRRTFGHWSALGLRLENNIAALDSGCLWGGKLSAMRLEDRKTFQVPCHPYRNPAHHE